MKRRWRTYVGIGLLTAVVFGPGLYHWVHLSRVERRLNRRLAELAAERERLAKEQQRLESDPAYVEGLIRSTFKLAKPGEYVIPLDPQPPSGQKH
jgi:cell division protein FtsB